MNKTDYFRNISSWILFLLAVVLFAGCADKNGSKETMESTTFLDKWQELAQESQPHSPPAARLDDGTYTITEKGDDEGKTKQADRYKVVEHIRPLPDQKITLNITDTEIVVIIRALARAIGQNIMINGEIKGKTNIYVNDVPWKDAFLSFIRTHGLGYSWEGDIIRIKTPEDMEKELKQLEKARLLEDAEPLINKVIKINYTDAARLRTNLWQFMPKDKEKNMIGTVAVDEPTNSIIIQSTRTNLKKLLPMIQELDRPTRQVKIEAHIVETTQDTAKALGVKWGGGLLKDGDNHEHWIHGARSWSGQEHLFYPADHKDFPNQPVSWMPPLADLVNFPIDVGAGGATLGYSYQNLGESILTIQLMALQKQGKLNIISNPSITTLDNHVATIESGQEVPYQTIEGTGADKEIKIEFKKAVLSLKVTPHVVDERIVKLEINTHKDELDFTNTVLGNPRIITKNAQTTVVLFDGQTTVIGGLNKETTTKAGSGVPGLQDAPLIGRLFKSDSNESKLDVIMIFITPHILKESTNIKMRQE